MSVVVFIANGLQLNTHTETGAQSATWIIIFRCKRPNVGKKRKELKYRLKIDTKFQTNHWLRRTRNIWTNFHRFDTHIHTQSHIHRKYTYVYLKIVSEAKRPHFLYEILIEIEKLSNHDSSLRSNSLFFINYMTRKRISFAFDLPPNN